MIITIDGPVASGKSTIGRILAHKLNYYYLCSGLLYRALGYVLVNHSGYTLEMLPRITQKDIDAVFSDTCFSYQYDELNNERIFFDNKDITHLLKDRSIDKIASIVSVNNEIRHWITNMQHDIAAHHNIVTDGRDMGSVVFPQAEYKYFITASVEVRAERWRKDQEKYGNIFSLQEAIAIITDRDERDKTRTIAPLIVPSGAITIDTSELNVEQTIEKVLKYIQ